MVFPVNFWEWRDRIVPNAEAYLKGARLYDWDTDPVYWSNTSNCLDTLVKNVWVDFPFTANEIMSETQESKWLKWRNGTLFVHEVAKSLYICNDMAKNAHGYITVRANLFKFDFITWSFSFLQNVLAKILSVNNIYRSLMVAVNNDVEVIIYFDAARIIRTLFDFDPIEVENPDEDWYYNPNVTYTDANGYW